jgi:hypothetical protein
LESDTIGKALRAVSERYRSVEIVLR